MKCDFSAINMRLFEIVGRIITALSRLLANPNCSSAWSDVDMEFVNWIKERNAVGLIVNMLTGNSVDLEDETFSPVPLGTEVMTDIGIRGVVVGYDTHPGDETIQMLVFRRTHNASGVPLGSVRYEQLYPHEVDTSWCPNPDESSAPAALSASVLARIKELETIINKYRDYLSEPSVKYLVVGRNYGTGRSFDIVRPGQEVLKGFIAVKMQEILDDAIAEMRTYVPDFE